MAKSTFEKNGGYFIGGVAYMDCKITGESVKNVSTDCKSVIGSRALTGMLHKKFPEMDKPSYKPTGGPAGWHWMKEFVDKDVVSESIYYYRLNIRKNDINFQ